MILDGGIGIAKTMYVTTAIPTNLTMTNNVTLISIDGTMASDSDSNLSTEHAIKTYVDNHNHVWYLSDEKTTGINGGTFTSGSWVTRTLNTIAGDTTDTSVTLSANQFTLTAGKYKIYCRAPGNRVVLHKCRLTNVTDTTYIYGSNAGAANVAGGQGDSIVYALVDITSTKVFRLEHRCSTSRTTDGLGAAMNFLVTETYATVTIEKVGTN